MRGFMLRRNLHSPCAMPEAAAPKSAVRSRSVQDGRPDPGAAVGRRVGRLRDCLTHFTERAPKQKLSRPRGMPDQFGGGLAMRCKSSALRIGASFAAASSAWSPEHTTIRWHEPPTP